MLKSGDSHGADLVNRCWSGADPTGAALEDITRQMACHDDAICTLQKVVEIVDRPQDIEDDTAMSFFGGEKGDAERSSG